MKLHQNRQKLKRQRGTEKELTWNGWLIVEGEKGEGLDE